MLATACGYTFAQIDEMTMSEFEMLSHYWLSHPPVHLMVAGYLGIKPKKIEAKAEDTNDLISFLRGAPGWTTH